ncbi:ATP-binding protein [Alicyclobacillus sacchari]|uniref:ATP-binding protein n=1 Tax=Alicyclobacillus sacchari TaxID=392010 RepID=UPI0014170D5D|nr:ATP-binding protein [Alicyclobacillus sacchari]
MFQSALIFGTFEAVNILLFLGVHWSFDQLASAWSTVRSFNYLSVSMSSILFVLIGRYDQIMDAILPVGLLLICFILMWQQYSRAVKSSSEATKKYQLIANHTDDLILLVNPSATITFASPSHARLFNKPLDEIVGQSLYTFIQNPDSVRAALEDNRLRSSLHQIRLQFGDRVVPTETKISPVSTPDNEIECFIVVSRDISERLRQQDYLLQTEKLAVAGQLAAGIAHEIRNPLTSVMGFLQLLREHFDQVSPESYRIVWSELVRISDIASSLLVLAKPEPAQFCNYTLDTIIRDTITLLEGQAHKVNVYFDSSPIPDVTLHCSPGQLKQVFLNLFKNSIEAMEDGGGTIRLSYDVQPEHVIIEVTDDGPGIPKHLLATLGQPFYTTKEKGTGLGLMVVYNIIQEHRGHIQFDSDGTHGTRVTIQLPIAQF